MLPVDDALPNEGGNVFRANGPAGGAAASWGGPEVAFAWRDPHTLTLTYKTDADIRFSIERLDDVTIILKSQP